MAQDFWAGPRKPCITGIQWHFWMKYLKINLKLKPFPWITYFFKIFKINPLCVVLNHNQPGPKGPMPHGKGLTKAWLIYSTKLAGEGVHYFYNNFESRAGSVIICGSGTAETNNFGSGRSGSGSKTLDVITRKLRATGIWKPGEQDYLEGPTSGQKFLNNFRGEPGTCGLIYEKPEVKNL